MGRFDLIPKNISRQSSSQNDLLTSSTIENTPTQQGANRFDMTSGKPGIGQNIFQGFASSPAMEIGKGINESIQQKSFQPIIQSAKEVGQKAITGLATASPEALVMGSMGESGAFVDGESNIVKGLKDKLSELMLNPKTDSELKGVYMDLHGKLNAEKVHPAVVDEANKLISREVPPNIPPSVPPNQVPTIEESLGKLKQALTEAKPIRGAQEKLYTQERGKRFGAMMGVRSETGGEQGYYKELGQLKGELPKKEFDSLREKISQSDIDNLFNAVVQSNKLGNLEKLPAREGLIKMLQGQVPTKNEINLLNQVLPPDIIQSILDKQPLFNRIGNTLLQTLNVPRSILASFDLSFPLRQGVFNVGRKEFYTSFLNMFKQFGSEKAFQAVQQGIINRPSYALMRDSKLALTDVSGLLGNREEQFMSNLAEKIPVAGRIIKASGRAYTGMANQLRADLFDHLLIKAKNVGIETNLDFTKNLARFINSSTGRGSLGSLERAAPLLNSIMFSPRLMASRLNLLNPVYYVKLDPFVRKEALKSLFGFTSMATAVLGLAKLNGASVGVDPRNADFGKIRIGNTRLDVLGGFQQYIRLAAQLTSGKIISSTTGKVLTLGEGYKPMTRLDILQRFFQGKENPVASFVTDFLQGQDIIGNKFNLSHELITKFVPLIVQDLNDTIKQQGTARGTVLSIPGIFGVGTQTYGNKAVPTRKNNNFNL